MNKNGTLYSFKRVFKVLIDIFLIGLSLVIAYKLRLDYRLSFNFQNWYWTSQLPLILPIVILIRLTTLFAFQIYSRMWRYTELNELLELTKPIITSSLLLLLPRLLGFNPKNTFFSIPYSIVFIDSILNLLLLSFARIVRKLQIETRVKRRRLQDNHSKTKRTLLIGGGQGAQEVAKKILQHPELGIEIVCALDDDIKKQDIKIVNDIRVIGEIKDLDTVVKRNNIEQILIAIPSLEQKKIKEIIELCKSTNIETKIIPGVDQLAGGKVTIEQIRKISLEDLLGRETVDLSIPEVSNFIQNKTILISGAGGSIGSELTRQLIKNSSPKKIYLLGRGEGSIFELTQELQRTTKIEFSPIICDIRNYKLLSKHIQRVKPDIIFHAAAHKHVPLMEDHPQEAFENNVIGTRNIAEIAGLNKINTFVNISTDKAVNPINVLGCTKRLAEISINTISKDFPETKFISVRFGNVIGSRGSVIPVWQNQIKNNMPISVTDKNAYRFFMTLQEASQLVIKAGAVGKNGEILVLDMGDEVNIYDIAQDFIKLSGFDLSQIKINITGLRPGEKLKEELVGYYEGTIETNHKKILVIKSQESKENIINKVLEDLSNKITLLDEIQFKKELIDKTSLLNNSLSKAL